MVVLITSVYDVHAYGGLQQLLREKINLHFLNLLPQSCTLFSYFAQRTEGGLSL